VDENKAYIREAKNEAEEYLGRSITDAEWEKYLPQAQRKLDFIIDREGDADGERRKPYYIGKLVEEAVGAAALSRWLDSKNELIQLHRDMTKNPECVDCGFRCIDGQKERSRLLSETAPVTTTLYINTSTKVNHAAI